MDAVNNYLEPGIWNGTLRWWSGIDSWLDVFGHEQRHVLSVQSEIAAMADEVKSDEEAFGCQPEKACQSKALILVEMYTDRMDDIDRKERFHLNPGSPEDGKASPPIIIVPPQIPLPPSIQPPVRMG